MQDPAHLQLLQVWNLADTVPLAVAAGAIHLAASQCAITAAAAAATVLYLQCIASNSSSSVVNQQHMTSIAYRILLQCQR
jgi:hypothetical protein